MNNATVIVVALLLLTNCTRSDDKASNDLHDALIGEWRNVSVKVVMKTFQNKPDVEKVTAADSTNWETSLHIKPIRTFFNADNTYHSDYYNLRDSLIFSVSGAWRAEGDTLVMTQLKPKETRYKLHARVERNTAKFTGVIDFDEDGKADDHYFGIQRRQ